MKRCKKKHRFCRHLFLEFIGIRAKNLWGGVGGKVFLSLKFLFESPKTPRVKIFWGEVTFLHRFDFFVPEGIFGTTIQPVFFLGVRKKMHLGGENDWFAPRPKKVKMGLGDYAGCPKVFPRIFGSRGAVWMGPNAGTNGHV